MSLRTVTVAVVLVALWPAALCAQLASSDNSGQTPPYASPVVYQQPEAAESVAKADAKRQPQSLERPQLGDAPPVPLKPRAATTTDDKHPGGLQMLVTVGGSLAVVLGLFLAVVWMLRRASPGGLALLPFEAFELLGRASLASRHQVQLVRCGNKLLLVSISAGGADASTLTEITDPDEVEYLVEICHSRRSGGAALRTAREREDRNA